MKVDVDTDVVRAAGARERAVLLILAAVQFTNIVDFMIVMPLGPQLMEKLSLSPSRFGMIVAAYTISASIAGFFAASFVDWFDRKTAFLSLYIGFLLGTLCCGLAPDYASLLVARVVTGAFGGVLGGLAMAIIADVFPEERRGGANAALMSAFAVASVFGVPFGLVLGERFGWHAPFFVLAALGLFVLPAGARFLPRLQSHIAAAATNPLVEIPALLTHPDHLRAFGLVISLMIGGFAVIPYIATYLVTNVGVPQPWLPLVYIAGGGITLFTAPLIGKLADRHGKYRVYRIIAPISAVFMLAATNLPRVPLWVAVTVTACLIVGNSGRMIVAMTMISSCVEPRRRGSFLSLNSSVQHLAAGLGASLGGWMIGKDAGGALTHYNRVGWVAVVATLISIAFAARLHPYSAAPATPEDLEEPLMIDVAADLL